MGLTRQWLEVWQPAVDEDSAAAFILEDDMEASVTALD